MDQPGDPWQLPPKWKTCFSKGELKTKIEISWVEVKPILSAATLLGHFIQQRGAQPEDVGIVNCAKMK